MCANGVTHKELNEALGRQTGIIIATVRRTEDSLKDNIDDVKEDVKAVSERVTYIERQGRTENVVGSVLSSIVAFVSMLFYNKFTGGSG